jgi:predicted nucleic acid-binding Zn ribbon protein
MSKEDNQQSLSDALKSFIKKNRLQEGLDHVRAKEAWEKVMGPGISNYTRKVSLSGDTLHVYLDSSVLREELSMGTTQILSMLNEELGSELIRHIRLQ